MSTKIEVKPTIREIPALKPADLKWQYEGFVHRQAFVRLPDGLALQDINGSAASLWGGIQKNKTAALRAWDQIRAVAYDESWFIDATVSHADDSQVILCGIKKTEMPKRAVSLYEDQTYKIEWAGNGYAVFGKNDQVRIGTQSFTNVEQAKQHLLNQYTKVA